MKNKFDLLILFRMISITSLLPQIAGQESKGKIIVKYDTSSDYLIDYDCAQFSPDNNFVTDNKEAMTFKNISDGEIVIELKKDFLDFSFFFLKLFQIQ